MKSSKFAIVGMAVGLVYVLTSTWWFYYTYKDVDKLITNILLGVAFIGMCFNYNRLVIHLNDDHDRLDMKMSGIDDLFEEHMRQHLETKPEVVE